MAIARSVSAQVNDACSAYKVASAAAFAARACSAAALRPPPELTMIT